jgi:negative modulator of initiation of replication
MKTIEIDDDIYEHLLRDTKQIGESASGILRRLLNIQKPNGKFKQGSTAGKSDLHECLSDPIFLSQSSVVGKLLAILSFLYKKDPSDFGKILNIKGRNRKYFGRDKDELDKSGKNVYPQRIPDTPYWITTNNDTPKKKRMLQDVLRTLGYDNVTIIKAVQALD